MTLFNDLWKKFKTSQVDKDWKQSTSSVAEEVLEPKENKQKRSPEEYPSQTNPEEYPSQTNNAALQTEIILNAFQESERESLQRNTMIENLKILQEIVNQPKEEIPELRFTSIKKHLGTLESHETVRQERWYINIHCPNCRSTQLKRLAQIPSKSSHNHRYQCLDCDFEFNDDTGTPMEKGLPPINIWMQCWYLMGCTDSINFIAAKLNLDISIVEMMMRQLQKTFQAQKPLTHFLGFDGWSEQSQALQKQLKEDLLRQFEALNANVATTPKDTGEFRRQQNLRRTLTATTEPPSPSNSPGKRRK